MAGSYPDVPGYRFAYDLDGTIVVNVRMAGGAIATLTSSQLAIINQDAGSSATHPSVNSANGNLVYYAFIFPELRNLTGYHLSIQTLATESTRTIQTSTDTTNGWDGTWNTEIVPYTYNSTSIIEPFLRSDIHPLNVNNVRAVRIAAHNTLWAVHWYGSIATTESPDRLRVVDMSGDDIAAQLDFGNIAQRSNMTKHIKIVNNSSTQTANNITVSVSAYQDASPSIIGQLQISTDNITFANAVNIGNLGPGAESGTLYVRNNVASDAQLGLWSARIIASAVSWS